MKLFNSLFLSLSAGLLLTLAYPPFGFSWLALPAFMLLFKSLKLEVDRNKALRNGYAGMLLWNVLSTYWLTEATFLGGVAAISANALVMLLPIALIHKMSIHSLNPWWKNGLLSAAIWTSFDYLHHNWDLAWPWLSLFNSFSTQTWAVQYISITGPWGITFWIIFVAYACYEWVQDRQNRYKLGTSLGALMLPPLISMVMLFSVDFSGVTRNVLVLQPNFDSYKENYGFENDQKAFEHIAKLTSDSLRARPGTIDLILWPENAINPAFRNYASHPIEDQIFDSVGIWQTQLLLGVAFIELHKIDKPVYPSRKMRNGRQYDIYNTATLYEPYQPPQYYRKRQLVPIVERLPFAGVLAPVVEQISDLNTVLGFGRGKEITVFGRKGIRTQPLVCYDSVFPSQVRKGVKKGANLLSIITNDGWWGDSPGHSQHVAYARLRAIETRRWIVRSANNGISAVISPTGNYTHKTSYWIERAFVASVQLLENKTFYVRLGDWFAYVCILGALISWMHQRMFVS